MFRLTSDLSNSTNSRPQISDASFNTTTSKTKNENTKTKMHIVPDGSGADPKR